MVVVAEEYRGGVSLTVSRGRKGQEEVGSSTIRLRHGIQRK